jgi:hypothetical protein
MSRPVNAPATPGRNETFTWSIAPPKVSHTARLRGPTTDADGTSARAQSSTSTGSPKQTGTQTSAPAKSSTEAVAACPLPNTWKART